MNYYLHNSDVTVELGNNNVDVHYTNAESFKVTLVDTGLETKTAGRLKRVQKYIGDEPFMLTYGDGVADINIDELLKFHKQHGKIATLTAVQPEAKFGGMDLTPEGEVLKFQEKPKGDGKWINGGFFVLSPDVLQLIQDDSTIWEREPLEKLSKQGQLAAFQHSGFWQPMDTLRDKTYLEELWASGKAPWKQWS